MGLAFTEQAIELIPALSDRITRGYAYWIAVPQFGHTRRFDRAADVLQSDQLTEAIPDFGFPMESRAFLEGHTMRGIDPAASTARFEQGLRMAEQIDDTHGAAWLGYHLAINRLIERDYERAANELAAVLPGLLAKGDHHAVAFAFGDYGDALGRLGRTAQATTAFAIADAQFGRVHMTTYDAYLRRRDRLLARYETTLGQDRFRVAQQQGEDMTIDEAVSCASAMLEDSVVSN